MSNTDWFEASFISHRPEASLARQVKVLNTMGKGMAVVNLPRRGYLFVEMIVDKRHMPRQRLPVKLQPDRKG